MTPHDAETSACPVCGGRMLPIAYGYPAWETVEAADRGEVVLGGCTVFDGQPTTRCVNCGADDGAALDERG